MAFLGFLFRFFATAADSVRHTSVTSIRSRKQVGLVTSFACLGRKGWSGESSSAVQGKAIRATRAVGLFGHAHSLTKDSLGLLTSDNELNPIAARFYAIISEIKLRSPSATGPADSPG